MTIPVYNTGTVSVTAGGTDVFNAGTAIWSNGNAKEGDWIVIDDEAITMVLAVVDTEHITIPPWQGANKTSVPYTLFQNYSARDDSTAIAKDVGTLVAALNKEGFIWFVGPSETDPDPSRGDEGQFAYQPTTGKQWHKDGGAWVYDGIFKGFGVPAPYDNGKTYSLNDVATSGGSSYVFINATPSAGHAPPNATYWAVLASIGATGLTGPTGPGYGGTSTTSLVIGTGSKAFTTQAGLAYTNGARVRASSSANPTNWMEGIAAYSGTTLTINVDKTNGSGTIASWNLNAVGEPGAGDLSSANNLSDLSDPTAARGNLGIAGPSQLRVTLTSLTPIMRASVAAATRVYTTPFGGGLVPIYDNTKFVMTKFPEVYQDTTDTTKSPAAAAASRNYDMFAWNDGGTPRSTRGPTWNSGASPGSDSVRGSGAGSSELVWIDGIPLNKYDIANGPPAQRGTYVGTVRTNAAATVDYIFGGNAAGGLEAVFNVWNLNAVPVATFVSDSTDTWNYLPAAANDWRAANGSSTMRASFVRGLGIHPAKATYAAVGGTNGQTIVIATGVGLNRTNGFDGSTGILTTTANFQAMPAMYSGVPNEGVNFLSANETNNSNSAYCTFFGDAGGPSSYRTGLHVELWQ